MGNRKTNYLSVGFGKFVKGVVDCAMADEGQRGGLRGVSISVGVESVPSGDEHVLEARFTTRFRGQRRQRRDVLGYRRVLENCNGGKGEEYVRDFLSDLSGCIREEGLFYIELKEKGMYVKRR